MAFSSVEYLAFLALTAIVYWCAPTRVRPVVLLVASYAFYASRDWRLAPILAACTVGSWLLARAMHAVDGSRRRALLIFTVGCSIAVVAGIRLWARGVGVDGGATLGIGVDGTGPAIDAIVPVGLAFTTFQIVSYVVDVYRRELEPQRSLVLYATYVAFFPHLLAGPVVRARRLVPQLLASPRRPDRRQLGEGLDLIFFGLFRKVAVADPLRHAAATTSGGSLMTLLQFVTTVLALYFDVAGYIDIARGSAKLLGIELPVNFAQPLTRSRNWTEFWRRWQITVMAWFRDYVYRPVRGRRHTGRRDVLGITATFLAAALWHGLSLGWVIWGMLTAAIMVIEQQVRRRRRGRPAAATWRTAARRVLDPLYLLGCLLITLPWTAGSLDETFDFYRSLFAGGAPTVDADLVVFAAWGLLVLVLGDRYDRVRNLAEGQADPVTVRRSFAYAGMALALLVFSGFAAQEFIYVQV